MARINRFARKINGVLLLDKRKGVSSNAALQEVIRLFHARKGGHTGSLDPLATGLLLICLGEATKLSSYLLNCDKRYQVTVHLGIATSTGDAEGDIIARMSIPPFDKEKIISVLKRFTGAIDQTPPMFSALKHNGVPLYELARKGIEIPRKSRTVSIYGLDLVNLCADSLELDVRCSKGTYIRSLAEDIAKELGCCGFVERLRRTAVGDFLIEQSWQIQNLQAFDSTEKLNDCLLSVDAALKSWPSVRLNNELTVRIKQGQAVSSEEIPAQSRWVKLIAEDDSFFAIGELKNDGKIAPRRILNLET